jgi:hypothetical protein
MRALFLIVILFFSATSQAQKKGRKVALEKSNSEEYKSRIEGLKKGPEQDAAKKEETASTADTSKKVSAFEKTSKRERKKMDATTASKSDGKPSIGSASDSSRSGPAIANTSAIAHGEARTPSAAVAKTYKYKADEKSAEYYNELRRKFEEEEKIRKEKEALLAIENAKKEEEIKQGRRLTEEQAPQFEKYRQGEKNPEPKKTTAEEDYNSLFK